MHQISHTNMPTQEELDSCKRYIIDLVVEGDKLNNKLTETKNELTETIDELNSVTTELLQSQTELAESKAETRRAKTLVCQLSIRTTRFGDIQTCQHKNNSTAVRDI